MAVNRQPAPWPVTEQGRMTRQRILLAAAELMHQRGVAATGLDDVLAATATSKSQLYHYFRDKSALVHAVIDHQLERVIAAQRPQIDHLDSIPALRAWAARVVDLNHGATSVGGCPLGRLASELSDTDPAAQRAVARGFARWQRLICEGLSALALPPTADREAIALGLLAALQGGLLLAQVHRDSHPLQIALDQAIDGIERLTAGGVAGR